MNRKFYGVRDTFNKIPEREMFVIAVSGKDYLLTIAKYVIELLGYDLKNDIMEYFIKPYNRFFNLN